MVWNIRRSVELFSEAKKHIPGGVNSPVRSFRAVGGQPVYIQRGSGARVYDVDGNAYIDYVLSWGPLIAGHAHPSVVQAIVEAAAQGTSFGAPTERETELACLVKAAYPSMDLVRFVNSGTEATMSAIRVARAYTRRDKVIKFSGCYHGHNDGLLVKAGSGALTFGVPDSPGVPSDVAGHTLTLPYNSLEALEEVFGRIGEQIACVILEPVVGNMGLVLPKDGYLQGLRRLTEKYGTLLIFDEVMTGFRVAYGGAQARFGITPDLTCLGKVIGGGLPVGAYGGRREIMDLIAPSGPVYQAGTLSGNPLAMAAGIAALKLISQPGVYEELERKTQRLVEGFRQAAASVGRRWQTSGIGSMFGLFFTEEPVVDFDSAVKSDTVRFGIYFRRMIELGVYLAPSQFEAGFLSLAHTDEDIDKTVEAAHQAMEAAEKANQG